jgi:predicted DNA binding protein
MWILKLKIKHDCTIGNRCERYKVMSYSVPLGNWKEEGNSFTSERHTIEGKPEQIKKFLDDIKKDKRVTDLEISGNTMFFIGKNKGKIPSSFYTQKMFFTKPVFVDNHGYEYWEVASYDRNVLSVFLKGLGEQHYEHLEMLHFKNVKLDNIYFPAIAPDLTERQKEIFELAVNEGYYDIPKRTDLTRLAKIMRISVATLQEHLKRAEAKIIPRLSNISK